LLHFQLNFDLCLVVFQAVNKKMLSRCVTVPTQIVSFNIIYKFKEIYKLY